MHKWVFSYVCLYVIIWYFIFNLKSFDHIIIIHIKCVLKIDFIVIFIIKDLKFKPN